MLATLINRPPRQNYSKQEVSILEVDEADDLDTLDIEEEVAS